MKVQTVPGFANGLSDGFPKFVAQEGYGGCALRNRTRARAPSTAYRPNRRTATPRHARTHDTAARRARAHTLLRPRCASLAVTCALTDCLASLRCAGCTAA